MSVAASLSRIGDLSDPDPDDEEYWDALRKLANSCQNLRTIQRRLSWRILEEEEEEEEESGVDLDYWFLYPQSDGNTKRLTYREVAERRRAMPAEGLFQYLSEYDEIDIRGLDTWLEESLACMFKGCSKLNKLNLTYTYEEQVAELHVDPPFMDESIVPLSGTWLRMTFVPESEHDWKDCCALRLDPTPDDDRPVGPDAPRVEIPRGKSLLSLDKLHDLFGNFQDPILHHCSTRDRMLFFVPIEGSDERMPAVLREARLSEWGFGTHLYLDTVIVTDHDRLMKHFGPPFYGWAETGVWD